MTTGEVLIRNFSVSRSGGMLAVAADLEWTFPLEFLELVWGDGRSADRKIFPAAHQPPFGSQRFDARLEAGGKKGLRFAAWDSAGNGAFTQPVHLD